MQAAADVPGYRRLIRIEPGRGRATAALEDDFHRMVVAIEHDGTRITAVEARTDRAPWTTCGGAEEVLRGSFTGLALTGAAGLGSQKRANCTHLYDLAVLAAAHALDSTATVYEVNVSDPVAGRVQAEVLRNAEPVWRWELQDDVLTAPAETAGLPLTKLRDWIASLAPAEAEAARLLQWASLVAHGRSIPLDRQSTASEMPPNCYTFQPGRAERARRIGSRFDFSAGDRALLDGFDPDDPTLVAASPGPG